MNYVLYGEEQYRLKKTLKTIISQYVQDEDDLNVITYDASQTSMDLILEDAMTIPFFSQYKVILVYHANFLSTNNDMNIDITILDDYIEQPMESTILIFIGEFIKLDTRKKIVKKIKDKWKVLEFKKLDEVGKKSFVQEQIKKRNIILDEDAYQELMQRLPLDMESIQRELEKLELYDDTITKNAIIQLVTKPLEENVFSLVNAVVEKNISKSFYIWNDLCVINTDAIYLIALLAAQFRFLYEVKVLIQQGQTKEEIVTSLNAHPYRVKLAMQSVEYLTSDYLMEMLAKSADLDQKLKGGLIEKKLGFEMFLLEL